LQFDELTQLLSTSSVIIATHGDQKSLQLQLLKRQFDALSTKGMATCCYQSISNNTNVYLNKKTKYAKCEEKTTDYLKFSIQQ